AARHRGVPFVPLLAVAPLCGAGAAPPPPLLTLSRVLRVTSPAQQITHGCWIGTATLGKRLVVHARADEHPFQGDVAVMAARLVVNRVRLRAAISTFTVHGFSHV